MGDNNTTSMIHFDKYFRMCKSGHPLAIIQQMLSVEVQCSFNDPRLTPVMEYMSKQDKDAPYPPIMDDLLRTKNERMRERGVSEDKLKFVPSIDDLLGYTKNVGSVLEDYVISDSNHNKSSNNKNNSTSNTHEDPEQPFLSYERAKQFKKEALYNRSNFSKSIVESMTDDIDTAPLTVPKFPSSTPATKDFYLGGDKHFQEPEIISQNIFQIEGEEEGIIMEGEQVQQRRRECVSREHLEGRMYSFLNVFSESECKKLVELLEFTKEEEAFHLELLQRGANKAVARTNLRRNFIDCEVTSLIWRVVKNVLPSQLPDGRVLAGVRTKMNYYRYAPGQYFSTHIDGAYRFTQTGQTSEYTFVVYLNDDFEGGETRFCPLPDWNMEPREVQPVQGGMLVFRQCDLKHCGVIVPEGYKRILQGMIMYGPIRVNSLGQPFGKEPQVFHLTTCDC